MTFLDKTKPDNDSLRKTFCWPDWAPGGNADYVFSPSFTELSPPIDVEESRGTELAAALTAGLKLGVSADTYTEITDAVKKFNPQPDGDLYSVGGENVDHKNYKARTWQICGRAGTAILWYYVRSESHRVKKKKHTRFRFYTADAGSTLGLAPGISGWDPSVLPADPYPRAGRRYGGFRLRIGDQDNVPEIRFTMPATLASELVNGAPSADVIAQFTNNGFVLSASATVVVVTPGTRWLVSDPADRARLRDRPDRFGPSGFGAGFPLQWFPLDLARQRPPAGDTVRRIRRPASERPDHAGLQQHHHAHRYV